MRTVENFNDELSEMKKQVGARPCGGRGRCHVVEGRFGTFLFSSRFFDLSPAFLGTDWRTCGWDISYCLVYAPADSWESVGDMFVRNRRGNDC